MNVFRCNKNTYNLNNIDLYNAYSEYTYNNEIIHFCVRQLVDGFLGIKFTRGSNWVVPKVYFYDFSVL